jgi:hypothetical protein
MRVRKERETLSEETEMEMEMETMETRMEVERMVKRMVKRMEIRTVDRLVKRMVKTVTLHPTATPPIDLLPTPPPAQSSSTTTTTIPRTPPASSASPDPERPALERRVYTAAELHEIRNTTLSVTPASWTEGVERWRLRFPPPPNYRGATLDGDSDIRNRFRSHRSKVSATAGPSDEDSQPESSEYEDSPEEDDGSELIDMRARWYTAGYCRRMSRRVVDTQTAIASFEASEDRMRATRFARLARSPAAAAAAVGNTTDGDAPSNDTTASSASPNPIPPAVERRVYTPADLHEIGQLSALRLLLRQRNGRE